jgi:hypothetical protein
MPKVTNIVLRVFLGFFSLVFSVLSLPPVRDMLWGKMVKKGKEKIVDAEAKVVGEDKKKGLFG